MSTSVDILRRRPWQGLARRLQLLQFASLSMFSRRTIGFTLVLILLFGIGRRPELVAQVDSASQVLQLVNQVRSQHGLAPFQYDPALAIAAQQQADFNAANSRYGHDGEGGSSPQDRANAVGFTGYVVENVVGGSDLTPEQGVTWWVNSPVHYNTLITTRYNFAATGYATKGRQRHYTLVVGRTADGIPDRAAPLASIPAIVAPIVLSEPAADGSITHQVRVGQTLWVIAARYQVTLEELHLFNNLAEEALIRPGDQLIIRLAEGQSPPPTPTPPLKHVVREGETLWTIAARYKLTLAEILWLNSLSETSFIQPADELTIRLAPGQLPPPTPTPQASHIVQSGQSLWGIAALYGLSVESLLALNDLDSNYVLQPGDELRIRPAATPVALATSILVTPEPTPATSSATSSPKLAASTNTTPFPLATPAQPNVTRAVVSDPLTVTSPDLSEPSVAAPFVSGALLLAILLTAAAIVVFILVRRAP